jgi:hypothetical protein
MVLPSMTLPCRFLAESWGQNHQVRPEQQRFPHDFATDDSAIAD